MTTYVTFVEPIKALRGAGVLPSSFARFSVRRHPGRSRSAPTVGRGSSSARQRDRQSGMNVRVGVS